MSKSRTGRHTLGIRAQVLIAAAIEYTAQADYKAFVASAAAGELGVFLNAYPNTLVPGNALLTTTTEIFIAVKRAAAEESILRTQPFRPVDLGTGIRYTPYVAPVKHVVTVTLGEGTTASAVIQDITYTSKAGGVLSNDISITYVVAGNSTALSVAVVGKAITVNLATNGGGAATSTATQVKAAVDASGAAAALVSAAITGTAATVQVAATVTNLQGGTTSQTMAKEVRFPLTILDMDQRYAPFPTFLYEIQAKKGESFDQAAQRLTNQINDPLSKQNVNNDRLVNAVYTAATNTLVLTAIDFGTIFKAVFPQGITDNALAAATQTVTTQGKAGSGSPAQVKDYELEGLLEEGVTTQYPMQGELAADYGLPTSFISASDTYDIFNFTGYNSEASKTPHARQFLKTNFAVISPLSGSNPTAELKTIFGF